MECELLWVFGTSFRYMYGWYLMVFGDMSHLSGEKKKQKKNITMLYVSFKDWYRLATQK